jgi:hypothetical protein
MPWISNEAFPGLAYCIGGRSLFWGGWSPELTPADLANWPPDIVTYLNSATGYASTEAEIGTATTTDFIRQTALFNALLTGIRNALPLSGVTEAGEAPLAVVGTPPQSGLFAFDKFSSAPFIMDAVRNDVGANGGGGDARRRMFVLPRTQVHRLISSGNRIVTLDLSVGGVRRQLTVAAGTSVILANGTIESTRLALDSLGVGSTQFGSPRVGNLMAHLRSNITVRIKRSALGLGGPAGLETTALLARGTAAGRRFHFQITAADVAGSNPEVMMWSMVPDIDVIGSLLANQDATWISITFRGIGEMENQPAVENLDPARSWIDLSSETDQWGMRRAYVNLVATANDRQLWQAMDKAAFDLALKLAGGDGTNIQYWNAPAGRWDNNAPQPDANGNGFWRDRLGTTHHEAGTLFMGDPANSITDLSMRSSPRRKCPYPPDLRRSRLLRPTGRWSSFPTARHRSFTMARCWKRPAGTVSTGTPRRPSAISSSRCSGASAAARRTRAFTSGFLRLASRMPCRLPTRRAMKFRSTSAATIR